MGSSEGTLELQDGTSLAYSLSVPAAAAKRTKLALIAHPLGRLGGTRGDPVVRTLSTVLQQAGWVVLTYDARGAGQSTGSASFSGTPESADYAAMLDRVLLPLLADTDTDADLLLAGYSFGSLAACACPRPRLRLHPNLRTRHLVVSYPLSVLWALTLFRTAAAHRTLSDLVVDPQADVLALFGDADQFSGVGALRTWRDALVAAAAPAGAGTFRAIEVKGADHFWRGDRMDELLREVKAWLAID